MTMLSTTLAGLSFPSCLMNASGSALMKEGPAVFARIQQELTAERATHETGA